MLPQGAESSPQYSRDTGLTPIHRRGNRIAQNAGFDSSIVVQKVCDAKDSDEGFNAQTLTAPTMTKVQKLRTLLAIVECAPAASAMTVFESAARRGDLSAFWDQYQEALRRSKLDEELKVVSNEAVSFEMLEPAMRAVYDLPTRD